jgi:uncharacterized protein GlcG (DUF336 family)
MRKSLSIMAGTLVLAMGTNYAQAACSEVSRDALVAAVAAAAAAQTGGYGLPMWVTMVNDTGKVCHVVNSNGPGHNSHASWLGSRNISAQKANTANAFSIDGYAISTANLYAATQPGGSLFGLQHSNPIDASTAYNGNPTAYGTDADPLINKRIGGVNVFGGGLVLIKGGKKIGAIGVSGDTSCRDHAFAWQVRTALGMHPGGVGITTANFQADGTAPSPAKIGTIGDEMILNVSGSDYWDAWSQPACPNSLPAATADNGTIQN